METKDKLKPHTDALIAKHPIVGSGTHTVGYVRHDGNGQTNGWEIVVFADVVIDSSGCREAVSRTRLGEVFVPDERQTFSLLIGYVEDLKMKEYVGNTVTVPKGAPVIRHGKAAPAGRTMKVKVNHFLNGSSDCAYSSGRFTDGQTYGIITMKALTNPSVRWPGSGGYWAETDINYIPELAGIRR